ncbi:hypothetical protein [Streptomyces rhizosphaerihabitans]|uniref:hypothetical protein n=1 Tax=Streptomyces rhizosphaerihabitans TaxID=1266770 RepID=UPI0021BE8523|nr:hypothetical protein [Streptomyces rhizosphaerihabitans]MCT9007462.1 hypothetical protein [Streptomyces rhizosphaerihabitans]
MSGRAQRQRAVRRLRAEGQYGPLLREVLPALAAVVVTLCAIAAGLAVGYRVAGVGVLLGALVVLAVAIPAAVRRHRPPARRRLGFYTPEELAELDTAGLALAVSRMLRRDGWRVLPPRRAEDRVRVRARDGRGQRLEVAFRPVAEPLPDEDAPSRSGRPGGPGPPLRLVVHRGAFTRRDVQWARRQGGVRLIDGSCLRRWAHGTPLNELSDSS